MPKYTNKLETPHKYSKEEARSIFQNACCDGSIISPKYARKRMRERDIDNNDILRLAKTGIVAKASELDIKTNEWTYRIETNDFKVVFVIPNPNCVRLITVF